MIDIDADAATVIEAQATPGVTQHVIRRIREAFGSDLYGGVQASAALGEESRSIFQDAHAANDLRPLPALRRDSCARRNQATEPGPGRLDGRAPQSMWHVREACEGGGEKIRGH